MYFFPVENMTMSDELFKKHKDCISGNSKNGYTLQYKKKNVQSDMPQYKYMDILGNGEKIYHGFICHDGEVL